MRKVLLPKEIVYNMHFLLSLRVYVYIKFWGVRGSVPSGNPETVKVGGNTTYVENRCGEELIVINTGNGFRNLGMALMKELPIKGMILYSHVHWDHI